MGESPEVKKKVLKGKDVCEIIKACAESGVLYFKQDGLEMQFAGYVSHQVPVKEITEDQHKRIEAESLTRDEMSLKTDEISRMLIENPSLAEDLIMDGELEDDGNGDIE